jgi:hypothetical protein
MEDADGLIRNRTEELFVCDEFQVFFLTGQANASGRKAKISVLPFHALSDERRAEMCDKARVWTREDSQGVRIRTGRGVVTFLDETTGVQTMFVRKNLEPDSKVMKEISPAFAKYAPAPIKTARDVAVNKPLTFRKNAP